MRILPTLPLLLLCAAVAGCTDPDEPDTPSGVTPSGELAMTRLGNLPATGGDVADLTITSDNTVVGAIDGKLYTLPASGDAPTLLYSDADYRQVIATRSGALYALTSTDVRVFDNIGASPRITSLDVANRFVEGVQLVRSPSDRVYVGINSYPGGLTLYTTNDGDTAWTSIPMPGGTGSLVYGTGVSFTPSGDLLVTNNQGLYRSSDRGATWTTLTTDMNTFGSGFQIFCTSNGDIYRYMSGVGNLGVSRDGGTSFTSLTPFNQPPLILDLREGEGGAVYAITLAGELLRSTDRGTTWKGQILCGACKTFEIQGSTIVLGLGKNDGGAGGLMLTGDNGAHWHSAGLATVENIQDIGFDAAGGLAILANNGLYRTGSAGWEMLGRSGGYSRFASARGGEFMVGNPGAVYHSTDNGATWSYDTLHGPQFGGPNDFPAMTVLIGRHNGGFIMSSGFVNRESGLASNTMLFSTDPYGKPQSINSPGAVGRVVEDLAGTLYSSVTYQNGITYQYYSVAYQSNDGGTTWQELDKQTAAQQASAVAFNSANGYLTLGGSTGIRFSKVTSTTPTELKLTGDATGSPSVVRTWFGPDDRLYILTRDQGLLISKAPLK